MLTLPLTIVAARRASTIARARLTPPRPSAGRSGRATPPATAPNSSAGRVWPSSAIETSSGSRVWAATSSGPAASARPSPALVMIDEASSQRKLLPSRRGATASTIGASGDRMLARIPSPQRRGTVPSWSVTIPPDMPCQLTSTRPASAMISAIRSGDG